MALCAGHGMFMDKLSSKKLCADEECVCKALLTVWFSLSFYHIMGKSVWHEARLCFVVNAKCALCSERWVSRSVFGV